MKTQDLQINKTGEVIKVMLNYKAVTCVNINYRHDNKC